MNPLRKKTEGAFVFLDFESLSFLIFEDLEIVNTSSSEKYLEKNASKDSVFFIKTLEPLPDFSVSIILDESRV
jgi:hypothetical protein